MKRLDQARRLGMPFNEETITESVLLKLSRRLAPEIDIKAYTKAEEKETGADWEFCFRSACSRKKYGVRVQAKRLYKNGQYGAIGGIEKADSQHDRLVQAVYTNGIVPIYVLYNSSLLFNDIDMHPIIKYDFYGFHECTMAPYGHGWPLFSPSVWGCSVAPVSDIASAGARPKPGALPNMKPWHWLFCRRHHPNGRSLPEIVADNLEELYGGTSMSGVLNFSVSKDIGKEREKVIQLLSPEASDRAQPETEEIAPIEKYLEEQQLAGIAVFYERGKGKG